MLKFKEIMSRLYIWLFKPDLKLGHTHERDTTPDDQRSYELERMDFDVLDSDDEDSVEDLDDVLELIKDFIGVVITGFERFNDDIQNIENKMISKFITGVYKHYDEASIVLSLSNLDNTFGGYLKLNVTDSGYFSELDNAFKEERDDEQNIRYQIKFFGDAILEYADDYENEHPGSIEYFSDIKNINK